MTKTIDDFIKEILDPNIEGTKMIVSVPKAPEYGEFILRGEFTSTRVFHINCEIRSHPGNMTSMEIMRKIAKLLLKKVSAEEIE